MGQKVRNTNTNLAQISSSGHNLIVYTSFNYRMWFFLVELCPSNFPPRNETRSTSHRWISPDRFKIY